MDYTLTISIGRNIGSTPMNDARWDGFRSAVRSVLRSHGAELFTDATGHGTWIDESGQKIAETSAVFIASLPAPESMGTDRLEAIRSRLAALAADHEQDAIGLVVAPSASSLVLPAA